MKKLFVIVLVALIALPAFSQINFGIKAGVNSSTVPTYTITLKCKNNNNLPLTSPFRKNFNKMIFLHELKQP